MKKISNRKMCHEALAKIIFGHFCRHGIRTWKSWPSFFKFQFMFILAILCNRRQETISIWLNIAFNYSFLRTPVGWIKCECHYWLVCVQTLPPPPPTLPNPRNKNQRRGGIVQNWPLQKRNWKQCLCKILGWQTKSVMVCYGIFWGGQYLFITGRRGGSKTYCADFSTHLETPTSFRVMIGINGSFLRVFCIFDERMRAITNLESFPGLINW